MATVTLNHVWLHDGTDWSDYVQLALTPGLEAAPQVRTERRVYASGRVRTVTRPGTMQSAAVRAELVPRDVLEWIESRLGTELMYRDPRGRVLWGTIAALPTGEHLWTDEADIQFTFQAITASAEV